jgi:hypothetical protein
MPFDSTKAAIGWEWKTFDMDTFTWTVADSTAFFVNTRKNNIYKLVFTKFEGSSTGNIVFNKDPLSSGIIDQEKELKVTVYPNPVKDQLNIVLGEEIRGKAVISIYDITGKLVYTTTQDVRDNILAFRLDQFSVCSGLHLMKVVTESGVFSSKFMVYKY